MSGVELGAVFQALVETGMSVNEVAREANASRMTVLKLMRLGRQAFRKLPRHLPRRWLLVNLHERGCDCEQVPIEPGAHVYCCSCSRCGFDGHPDLQRVDRGKSKAKARTFAGRMNPSSAK